MPKLPNCSYPWLGLVAEGVMHSEYSFKMYS